MPYLLTGMSHVGIGACDAGYYAGWDGKAIESQEACNALCLSESQCTYVAYWNGQTCSRYMGKTCNLLSEAHDAESHVVYKKQPGRKGMNWRYDFLVLRKRILTLTIQ